MKRLYAALSILCLISALLYWLLPYSHFSEEIYPLHPGTVLFAYDDADDQSDGISQKELSVDDSSLIFSCRLHTGKRAAWCGLLLDFSPDSNGNYRNWMLVDSLIFDLEVSGTKEFLLKLWTYDPDVTNPKNKHSFRLLIKELDALSEGRQRVALALEDFYVPDYWFEFQKVDRNLTQKHLEGVARLEIAPGWNTARGKPFSFRIYSIETKGISSIPLGFLLLIFLIAITIVVGVRRRKGK